MPYAQVPPHRQPATFLSLRDLAASQGGVAESQALERLASLGQALGEPLPDDFDAGVVGFLLASRDEVETVGFMSDHNVGVVVSCVGARSQPFMYRTKGTERGGYQQVTVPVAWAGGRNAALNKALPDVVTSFLSKQTVLVHCNHSFHRGPLGFVVLAKTIFGCEPNSMMNLLAEFRIIYNGFDSEHRARDLWDAFQWAKQLQLWQPQVKRVWHVARSGASASSSSGHGAGGPAILMSNSAASAPSGSSVAASQGLESQFLYRAMTVNLTEFEPRDPPTEKGLDLAVLALDAVATGSSTTSPFMHFSTHFCEARKWQIRGMGPPRNERGTLMCRVSKDKLQEVAASQGVEGPPDLARGLVAGEMLDLSTTERT